MFHRCYEGDKDNANREKNKICLYIFLFLGATYLRFYFCKVKKKQQKKNYRLAFFLLLNLFIEFQYLLRCSFQLEPNSPSSVFVVVGEEFYVTYFGGVINVFADASASVIVAYSDDTKCIGYVIG